MSEPHPLLGRSLGGYVLERHLATGGMGDLFAGRDPTLDREVAIKVIRPHLALRRQAFRRFQKEGRLAAGIEDPHVVPVLQLGEEDGLHFLVMPLVEGEDLSARVRRGLPGMDEVRDLLGQAARGLAALHAAGVIHRDIKPSNLLIGSDGRLRLIDLGIARSLADESALTATGQILGTPAYMAPEQIRGQPVDARTDLYSLGLVLYFLLTGRRPFDGPSPVRVMARQCDEPVPDPRQVRPDVPAAVVALLRLLTVKDPAGRPGSAGELLAALERLERGESLPEPVAIATTAGRSRRAMTIGLPVVAAIVVVVAVAAGRFARTRRTPGSSDRPDLGALDPRVERSGRALRAGRLVAAREAHPGVGELDRLAAALDGVRARLVEAAASGRPVPLPPGGPTRVEAVLEADQDPLDVVAVAGGRRIVLRDLAPGDLSALAAEPLTVPSLVLLDILAGRMAAAGERLAAVEDEDLRDRLSGWIDAAGAYAPEWGLLGPAVRVVDADRPLVEMTLDLDDAGQLELFEVASRRGDVRLDGGRLVLDRRPVGPGPCLATLPGQWTIPLALEVVFETAGAMPHLLGVAYLGSGGGERGYAGAIRGRDLAILRRGEQDLPLAEAALPPRVAGADRFALGLARTEAGHRLRFEDDRGEVAEVSVGDESYQSGRVGIVWGVPGGARVDSIVVRGRLTRRALEEILVRIDNEREVRERLAPGSRISGDG